MNEAGYFTLNTTRPVYFNFNTFSLFVLCSGNWNKVTYGGLCADTHRKNLCVNWSSFLFVGKLLVPTQQIIVWFKEKNRNEDLSLISLDLFLAGDVGGLHTSVLIEPGTTFSVFSPFVFSHSHAVS